jgi:hypothetical protein
MYLNNSIRVWQHLNPWIQGGGRMTGDSQKVGTGALNMGASRQQEGENGQKQQRQAFHAHRFYIFAQKYKQISRPGGQIYFGELARLCIFIETK